MKRKRKLRSPKAAQAPSKKLTGVPIEDVIEPHPHNRKRPSLAVVNPEAACEWYYEKNCGFGPEDFSYGSQVNVWWRCSRDKRHIWRTRILSRGVQGRDCPSCFGTNIKVVPPERSLATCHPDLAKEWHATKNKGLTPKDVLPHCTKLIWWQCASNPRHSWQADPGRRVSEHSGCPHCWDERLLDLRDHPDVLRFFDKEKNKGINPNRLTVTTEVWWRCPEGPDHSWCKPFRNKKTNFGCPFCRNRKASITNALSVLFPELARELHPTKNDGLKAKDLPSRTNKRVTWRCSKNPRHVWQTSVRNRTMNGSGCPECWSERRPAYFAELAAARKKKKR